MSYNHILLPQTGPARKRRARGVARNRVRRQSMKRHAARWMPSSLKTPQQRQWEQEKAH